MNRHDGDTILRYAGIAIAIVIIVAMLWRCDGLPVWSELLSHGADTVVVTLQDTITPPPITITDTTTIVRYAYRQDTVIDTAYINVVAAQIDALRDTMLSRGARRAFAMDTVTSSGDTIYVECDETTRAIALRLRHAPIVRTLTTTVTTFSLPRLRPYLGVYLAWQGESAFGAVGVGGMELMLTTPLSVDLAGIVDMGGQSSLRLGVKYYY